MFALMVEQLMSIFDAVMVSGLEECDDLSNDCELEW